MTHTEFDILVAVVVYGGVSTFVGYCFGSLRTFAHLGYGSETIRRVLRTLRPWFGNRELQELFSEQPSQSQWLRFLSYFDVPTNDQSKRFGP